MLPPAHQHRGTLRRSLRGSAASETLRASSTGPFKTMSNPRSNEIALDPVFSGCGDAMIARRTPRSASPPCAKENRCGVQRNERALSDLYGEPVTETREVSVSEAS